MKAKFGVMNMKYICLLLSGFFSLLLINIAHCESSSSVWKQLQDGDKSLSQGYVSYLRTDSAVQHSKNAPHSRVVLHFTNDGRFSRTEQIYNGQPNPFDVQKLYDGHDEFVVFHHGKEVQIVNQNMALKKMELTTDMAPGPCFPLGRGLSQLQKPKIIITSSSVLITGVASDGTSIEATLDPQHEYVAKLILRRQKSELISRWTLGAPVRFAGSTFIASSAICSFKQTNALAGDSRFKITDANFSQPNEDIFHVQWQNSGTKVVDARLGQELAVFEADDLTHHYGTNISSAHLLNISRNVIIERNRLHERNEEYRRDYLRQQRLKPLGSWLIIALLVSSLTGMAVLLTRRSRSMKG